MKLKGIKKKKDLIKSESNDDEKKKEKGNDYINEIKNMKNEEDLFDAILS